MIKNDECLGCGLANNKLKIYTVYENDYVNCILDYQPFNDGHTLILPKHHYKENYELDVNTYKAIMDASVIISKAINKVYKPDGITICQNGGVFNELNHYHMHVVPRYTNQDFANFYKEDGVFEEKSDEYFKEEMKKLKETIYDILKK